MNACRHGKRSHNHFRVCGSLSSQCPAFRNTEMCHQAVPRLRELAGCCQREPGAIIRSRNLGSALMSISVFLLPSIGCCLLSPSEATEAVVAASELRLLLSDITEAEEDGSADELTDLLGLRFWLKWRTKKLPAARAGPLAERSDWNQIPREPWFIH